MSDNMIPFTDDELISLIGILRFSQETFSDIVKQATDGKDENKAAQFNTRAQVAEILYDKVVAFAETGKPLDKNGLH